MFFSLCVFLLISIRSVIGGATSDVPCEWRSLTGAHFDLKPLMERTFQITDGDIACTPETEPAFTYTWNFCKDVPKSETPKACSMIGKGGVALQSIYLSDEESDCYIIGHYDPSQDDLYYHLMDTSNPTKGVSMTYPSGEKCKGSNVLRQATIDVQCANTKSVVVEANSPVPCGYHLLMKSYHGCPTECPITSSGLCSSHGLCMYDESAHKPYCYCNQGYQGADCSQKTSVLASYDGFSVQIGLLVTLLLVTLGLLGVVGYMVFKMMQNKKAGKYAEYGSLPAGTELVETVQF